MWWWWHGSSYWCKVTNIYSMRSPCDCACNWLHPPSFNGSMLGCFPQVLFASAGLLEPQSSRYHS